MYKRFSSFGHRLVVLTGIRINKFKFETLRKKLPNLSKVMFCNILSSFLTALTVFAYGYHKVPNDL